MEGIMWGSLGLGLSARTSPLGQAQEIIYRAFDEPDPERRVHLARKALAASADCADAYALPAEHTHNRKKQIELFEQGVAAGERAIGRETFLEGVGHFWGILETRPYMRAREGLAHALWSAGRRDEAVSHLQDMLRLNPNDNQGLRYSLTGYLLCLDRDEELSGLLDQFPDEGSAMWAHTRALLHFREHGDCAESRQLLQEAKKRNKHVPGVLLGLRQLPPERPPYYSPGEENEAIVYAEVALAAWKGTPGAMTWLRQFERAEKQPRTVSPKGPSERIKTTLRRLPASDVVWEVDFRRVPDWIKIGTEKVRPWTVLVGTYPDGMVLTTVMTEDAPSSDHLWDALVQAMKNAKDGEPHRPAQIRVRAGSRWDDLKAHIESVGIRLITTDRFGPLDEAFAAVHEHVFGEARPGLLDVPGVSPEPVRRFYEAAAEFYRRAVWKIVGDDSTIKVECDRRESGPWHAVIMGQAGLTLGLALYEDEKIVRLTQAGDQGDEENAQEAVALSVTFDEESDLPGGDVDAIREHGWPVAGPEAFPGIFKKERGMSIRPPLAWELELMEGCLCAIPEFVHRRQQDDPTEERISVPTVSGLLGLRLSWLPCPSSK
jgi:hypothetical protein